MQSTSPPGSSQLSVMLSSPASAVNPVGAPGGNGFGVGVAVGSGVGVFVGVGVGVRRRFGSSVGVGVAVGSGVGVGVGVGVAVGSGRWGRRGSRRIVRSGGRGIAPSAPSDAVAGADADSVRLGVVGAEGYAGGSDVPVVINGSVPVLAVVGVGGVVLRRAGNGVPACGYLAVRASERYGRDGAGRVAGRRTGRRVRSGFGGVAPAAPLSGVVARPNADYVGLGVVGVDVTLVAVMFVWSSTGRAS